MRRWFFGRISWLALGLLALCACSLLPGARPDVCQTEGKLFVDAFDHEGDANLCQWALFRTAGAAVEIADGALVISISDAGQIAWTNPGRDFTDVVITAQTREVSGPGDNAYGLICRYRDAANFYVFLISGDGYYAIGKYDSDSTQVKYLTGPEYLPSDFINQGAAANRLSVRCVGDELSLTVNGELLATVRDSAHTSGDIGLAASPFAAGRLVIEFDDVQVSQP